MVLGFEQANRYAVKDGLTGETVAFLAEEDSLTGVVTRQLLRRRRPFTSTLLTPEGDVLLRVRRKLYLLESNTLLETAEGEVVGEVHQVWHLWKRSYDVFVDKKQFGRVRAGLLSWEFVIEDAEGRPLAKLDRNFGGLAKEIFTDAGCYALTFLGSKEETPKSEKATSESQVTVAEPGRKLRLDERTICLALAVAIDFDFFSQHSSLGSPGLMGGGMPMPIPMGGFGGGESSTSAEPTSSAAEEEPIVYKAPEDPAPSWQSKEDLGGDSFKPNVEQPTWTEEEDLAEDKDDGGEGEDGGGGGGGLGALAGLFGFGREE